ncbi:MAG: 5'-nucleotidase C-terminal domain-containing protein [Myxococcaceae bacterium]
MNDLMRTALLTAALLASGAGAAGPRCVAIIGTNDFHGHVDAESRVSGRRTVHQGGLDTFAGYLSILRARYPRTVLVDAGDLFQGTLVSNESKGAAVIAAYNALGYNAAALGNHEFDFGPDAPAAAMQGSLKERLLEADFPFLAANIYERATHKRVQWKNLLPSTLIELDGVRVGIIGAVTPDTPTVTLPAHVKNLEFHDPAADIIVEARELRRRHADLVVLVSHIGGACSDRSNPEDTSSCDPGSELFKLLERLPPGTIDVAVGGHTHQYVAHHLGSTAVIESGAYGRSFGWLVACLSETGRITTNIEPPQDLCAQVWNETGCGGGAKFDPKPATFLGQLAEAHQGAVELALEPFRAKVRDIEQADTGVTLARPLERQRDRPFELGRLVASSMLKATPGADLAVTNSGGIRSGLPGGAIPYGRLFEVLPFDNRLVTLELTGKQIAEFVAAPLRAGHGFPQLAGGSFTYEDGVATVQLAGGRALDGSRKYLVVTNDFLAAGGDGTGPVTSTLAPTARHQTSTSLRDTFLSYLKSLPQPVTAQE